MRREKKGRWDGSGKIAGEESSRREKVQKRNSHAFSILSPSKATSAEAMTSPTPP